MIITAAILWSLIGMSGFAFWWTKDYDLSASELPIMICSAVMGPISWVLGYFIHSKKQPFYNVRNAVFIRKRG